MKRVTDERLMRQPSSPVKNGGRGGGGLPQSVGWEERGTAIGAPSAAQAPKS